jgi:hypothetical protein
MVKVLKGNVRCMLAGACCAAVMIMCGGVWGMKTEDTKKCMVLESTICLTPINVDFPFFLGNRAEITPSDWRLLFKQISSNIDFLTSESNEDNLYCALGAVIGFCFPFSLKSFVCFMNSDCFDLESTNRVIAFLKLFPKVLTSKVINRAVVPEDMHDVDEYLKQLNNVREPLEQLASRLSPDRKPFLTPDELKILSCIRWSI